jgi:hypothetical protein
MEITELCEKAYKEGYLDGLQGEIARTLKELRDTAILDIEVRIETSPFEPQRRLSSVFAVGNFNVFSPEAITHQFMELAFDKHVAVTFIVKPLTPYQKRFLIAQGNDPYSNQISAKQKAIRKSRNSF